MVWPDQISIYYRLQSAPQPSSDSFDAEIIILSQRHQRIAARCWESLVMYDYRQGRKMPLRPFMIQQFSDTWKAQEKAKAKSELRARELMMRVKSLEKDSWDRPGAIENMGGS